MSELYRQIPAVDALLAEERLAHLPREMAVWLIRKALTDLRARIAAGELQEIPDLVPEIIAQSSSVLVGRIRPVLNGTGVVIHTNLGRSPWPVEAIEAAGQVASGYCNLELDLESGRRGGRLDGVATLLRYLTGAEASLVVNNCAAAVLLGLTALAGGREVVVSRGELVEIGGSFRVPDVIASGGAALREVGTTNRTRIQDYADAVNANTAVFLKVHRSNFEILGFTEEVALEELVSVAQAHSLYAVVDQGCGSLEAAQGGESVRQAVAAGADVVLFSGDKLLGGPQAGFAVGKKEAIERLRKHPLYRALRVDKTLLAAVEATLVLHARGDDTPIQEMVQVPMAELEGRGEALITELDKLGIVSTMSVDEGFIGGGSSPGEVLESRVVAVESSELDRAAAALRCGVPAVVPRVAEGRLIFDLRTLGAFEPLTLAEAVARAINKG
jgi:L-seryl-tRNA(Ser) seleniumtransferase